MVSLGPRVGGAHVDVNLKFDDKSLDSVGKRIHRQLASIGDRNREVYRSIGRDSVLAWRAALGATVAAAPLMGSAISGLAGAATMLAGSMYSVGQTSYAALPILTSLGVAGLTASIGMRNFSAAVSEIDPDTLKLLLKGMPKSMQEAVMSTRKLSNEMRAAVWPKLFAGLSDGINDLRETGVIQRGLGAMADSINGVVKSILAYANTKEGISTLNKFFQNNAKVFEALGKAVVPFLDGFLRLVNALVPASLRLANRITDTGKRFQSWTKAEGFGQRINEMMKKAEKTAGLLFKVLGNLGSAILNVFNITNPATNTFLQMLVGVTERFKDFTESAGGKNTIAEWATNSIDVMRQLGKTVEAIFSVTSELADSRVIISFLKTLEDAFIILGDLPLDKLVDGFVRIAEAIQPVSSLFLAIIIAGAATNIMIGSLIGQVAGLFSVFGRLGGISKKGLFPPNVGKHAAEVSKIVTAFKGLGSILAKGLKFAGLAGMAVWIVTIIAKSDKLKSKVMDVWDSIKGVFDQLVGAFDGIKSSSGPLLASLQPVFDFMDKLMGLAIGVFLDMIVYGFESLGNVVEGAGKIIAGLLDVLTGIFTLDFGKVWEGLKKMFSGLGPLLKGAFGLFITFFAPAKFLKLGLGALKGLLGGLVKALPGILGFLVKMVGSVLKFLVMLAPKLVVLGFNALKALGEAMGKAAPGVLAKIGSLVKGVILWIAKLPGKLISLGRKAITVLSDAFRKYAPKVLLAAAKIYIGVIKWIAQLPGKLILLGRKAITMLSDAVGKGIPILKDIAGKIVKVVVDWLGKLPGRLFKLGKDAIRKLGEAIRAGVSKVKDIAGKIVTTVVDKIKGLPGEMLAIGKDIIGSLISGITGKLKDLGGTMGKVAGKIGKFLPGSPVQEGPLTAWNRGSGATGGGRNVIDAITSGLNDTDPIKRAMSGVADAVATSMTPRVGSTVVDNHKPTANAPGDRTNASGGDIYISKMMPHNYNEFERQIDQRRRLATIGGRRP